MNDCSIHVLTFTYVNAEQLLRDIEKISAGGLSPERLLGPGG
jgi:hypothetical protein